MKTGVGTRRTAAGREGGLERVDLNGCFRLIHLRTGSTLLPTRICSSASFPTPWPSVWPTSGPRSTGSTRTRNHLLRPGTPYGVGYLAGSSLYDSNGGMGDFESAVSSSISTYQASQSSSVVAAVAVVAAAVVAAEAPGKSH